MRTSSILSVRIVNRAPRLVCVLLATVAFVGSALAQQFGRIEVGPGEYRQVSIGPAYRMIRVCNDFGSPGTVEASISDGWVRTLQPGACLEDAGSSIAVRNRSAQPATVTFRSSSSSWMQREQ